MKEYDLPLQCCFCGGDGKGYVRDNMGSHLVDCWHCNGIGSLPVLELKEGE